MRGENANMCSAGRQYGGRPHRPGVVFRGTGRTDPGRRVHRRPPPAPYAQPLVDKEVKCFSIAQHEPDVDNNAECTTLANI